MSDDCGCIYLDVDSDAVEVVTMRMARKAHRCLECRRDIQPGQRYEVRAQFAEGSASTFKTCSVCAEIRNAFFCSGWYYGDVWQQVRESMFEDRGLTSACLEKLATVEAKQFLQQRWWTWVESRTNADGAVK